MEKKMRYILLVFIALLRFSFVQGQAVVSGLVLEQDSISPIAGAAVVFSGISVSGDTLLLQSVSDTIGAYELEIENGTYQVSVNAEGYSLLVLPDSIVMEGENMEDFNFVLYEEFHPVQYVEASIYSDDYVRIIWSMSDTVSRSFRYFSLFRSRFDEEPVVLVSHLTDTIFMEMHWNSLDWGQYRWGVCCHYEGNRGDSDTVWSAFLDKDMLTCFSIEVTTNIGLSAEGALVSLVSETLVYQDTIGSNGMAVINAVYRDDYTLQVSLDGYVDYVSDSLVAVMDSTQVNVELQEAIRCVDSLYVSSTGWLEWHLADTLCRGLQYFEIQVDSSNIVITTENGFQLDVSGCEPGQSYLVKVRPVYCSTSCAWTTFDWVYQECVDYHGVEGFNFTLEEDAVLLTWTYPEGDEVIGAMLYRDATRLGFVSGDSYLDENAVMEDSIVYSLRVVYGGPTDGHYYSMSCDQDLTVLIPIYCDPPKNLEGEKYYGSGSDFGALISWGDRPPLIEEWLHYDNGEYKNSVGGGDERVIFWSVRFDAEDLVDYQGAMMTKVSVYDVGAGTYQLWVYVGGETAPRTLVCTQNMNFTGSHNWHQENLFTAVEIPDNEPIWVVIGQQGLSRPAAACADMGNPNGRWVSLNGSDWVDLLHYNLHYTWMVRAFVTNRSGKVMALGREGLSLQQFNLYRSVNNSDYQKVASIPYDEATTFYQYRDPLVGATCDRYYYRLTAFYQSDDGHECESEYAASLLHPEEDFVMVDDVLGVADFQFDAIKVYPNPASSQLQVEADGMQRVSIYNALGQCVISEKLAKDETQLDFSDLPNGLYLLKVETKNGVANRRFVVAH